MLNLTLAVNKMILMLFFLFTAGCSLQFKLASIKQIKPSSESKFKRDACFLDCSKEKHAFGKENGFTEKCGVFDELFPLKENERIIMKKGIIVKKTYYSIFMGTFFGPVPYKICYLIKAEQFNKDLSGSEKL